MTLIHLPLFALLVSGIFCQYDYNEYYYDPASQRGPSYPICSVECDCPMNFPTAMYCDNRKLKTIPMVPSTIKYLYLQNNQLTGIPNGAFDNATELLWLILDHNQITSSKLGKKAFSKLKRLQKLYINFNNLTELVVTLPKSLEEVKVSSNQISKIGSVFSGQENLTVVHLNDNQLTDVGDAFSGLKSLMYLDLSLNKLTKLPSGLSPAVMMLYADHNSLSSIPKDYFEKTSNLQHFRISYNQLNDEGIPDMVFNITSLLELDLSFNKLKSIPVVNENLENLYLQANEIEKFSLSSFCRITGPNNYSRVRHLRLDANKITQADLPYDTVQCLRQASDIMVD